MAGEKIWKHLKELEELNLEIEVDYYGFDDVTGLEVQIDENVKIITETNKKLKYLDLENCHDLSSAECFNSIGNHLARSKSLNVGAC